MKREHHFMYTHILYRERKRKGRREREGGKRRRES